MSDEDVHGRLEEDTMAISSFYEHVAPQHLSLSYKNTSFYSTLPVGTADTE